MTVEPKALPRLTRLELHGFKSFANRTSFVFEPGITAVIGLDGVIAATMMGLAVLIVSG